MKYFAKIFVLFLGMIIITCFSNTLRAQESENHDEITIIAIYIKVQTEGLDCIACSDTLRKRLEAIDGAKNIEIFPERHLVLFEIPSHKIISEKKVREVVTKAGFYPIQIEFSKERYDEESDEPVLQEI